MHLETWVSVGSTSMQVFVSFICQVVVGVVTLRCWSDTLGEVSVGIRLDEQK